MLQIEYQKPSLADTEKEERKENNNSNTQKKNNNNDIGNRV